MIDFVIISGAILLALMGIANTLVIAEILGRKGASAPELLKSTHRWIGRIFMILFTAIFLYMAPRIGFFENMPVNFLIHGFLGIIIFTLLITKFCVVRRYKGYMSALPLLGVYIMLGTVLIVMSSVGVELFKYLSR
ncbi:MAG: DUF6529 family protein [Desulfomonilaceae bacterium]